MPPTLTVTLTVEQLLAQPFCCVVDLLRHAGTDADPEFLKAAYAAERTGRCRHPILDHLRPIVTNQPS